MRIRDEAETQRKEGNIKPPLRRIPNAEAYSKHIKVLNKENVYKRK